MAHRGSGHGVVTYDRIAARMRRAVAEGGIVRTALVIIVVRTAKSLLATQHVYKSLLEDLPGRRA